MISAVDAAAKAERGAESHSLITVLMSGVGCRDGSEVCNGGLWNVQAWWELARATSSSFSSWPDLQQRRTPAATARRLTGRRPDVLVVEGSIRRTVSPSLGCSGR